MTAFSRGGHPTVSAGDASDWERGRGVVAQRTVQLRIFSTLDFQKVLPHLYQRPLLTSVSHCSVSHCSSSLIKAGVSVFPSLLHQALEIIPAIVCKGGWSIMLSFSLETMQLDKGIHSLY
ncbi:hypothetical protein NE237_006598 [Protea cynaroides]|uniref:Uncharacterized protein n=1 Tax=Protea cynaroides TaxID=273540 RepID=A0A9Q0QVP1_9MAGN|nr:hypothetical protein NE237_006598 [Protea cynaroides]